MHVPFDLLYVAQVFGWRNWGHDIQGREYLMKKIVHSSHYCQVDPNKKVEVGSFRLSGDGNQNGRKLVSLYWWQLAQNLVSVSFRFHTRAPTSTYQKWWTRCARTSRTTRRPPPRLVETQLSSGSGLDPGSGPGWPLLQRLMTIEGNMNPKMSEVDIVPDDDLNTRLKFYVSDKTDTDSTSNPIRRTNAWFINFSAKT